MMKSTVHSFGLSTNRNKWIFLYLMAFYFYCLFINSLLPLAPDEAYYWYWAKNPDWSYFDHPPMVAYLMAFFTRLGGDSEFFVRFGGFLCVICGLICIFATTRRLFPDEVHLPWEILFIMSITLLFPAGAIIQTPDTPMLFFWALALYCGSRIITDGDGRWWYLWGCALGAGFLSKYTMVLVVPCQFCYLLLARQHRYWLFRKEPYLALLIGLAVVSPVIIWNWQHDWVSFAFQMNQGFSTDGKAVASKIFEYAGGQAGIVTPILFLCALFYGAAGFYLFTKENHASYLYLLLLSWPVVIFFGLTTILGETAEANWPAPAYVAGLILMWAVYRHNYDQRRRHRIFVKSGIILALAITLIVHVHLNRPFLPLSPSDDPMRQLHSWNELGRDVNRYIAENPHADGYFLLSDKGTTVAEAIFYTGAKYDGFDLFIPQRYMFLGNLEQFQEKNALILLHKATDARINRYRSYFDELIPLGRYTHVYRGETIKELSVDIVLGKRFRGNWLHGGKI